ncbi:pyrimidine/purine nucleoside phosphorylase [Pseudodesulfovibrio piezophilus]|uniref:Pyrimidine/purine nucleoside phosphorylase n=1 Tax=Pseudodesulfovibrio piezophilus (strain DSM 21447 / JCM 15486 / C1TLV30) TaxID=1322246 RepID=M1WVX1_PSEP2|nr:pyrimidine/purine nucleoside phosphorylase [Pseudodesulfovibrio piezophilus]CCH48788.1 conserved protein of unknown function [Pseudodesulfovibrio piezophilus C1TLV30]
MDEFAGVTVNKSANIYFDGNVSSRKITFADGSVKTLGVMLPGEYEFGTEKAEIMDITTGELSVLLPESHEWETFKAGESFNVPADSSFQIKVAEVTDYCCSYVD